MALHGWSAAARPAADHPGGVLTRYGGQSRKGSRGADRKCQTAGEKLQASLKKLEQEATEAKDKLTRALAEKQAAEKSAGELKTQAAEAVAAKEAAERALAEAKKPQ
jgi:hypothetical protein